MYKSFYFFIFAVFMTPIAHAETAFTPFDIQSHITFGSSDFDFDSVSEITKRRRSVSIKKGKKIRAVKRKKTRGRTR